MRLVAQRGYSHNEPVSPSKPSELSLMGAHNGFTIKKQPEDGAVVIVQRKQISQYLLKLPQRLTASEIDAIYEVARRSSTWC